MDKAAISPVCIRDYADWLVREEKSAATIEKYTRYARSFAEFIGDRALTKEEVITFKQKLSGRFTANGANGVLAAVNSLLRFLGKAHLIVKQFKIQRRLFTAPERELSRTELDRLVASASTLGKSRLRLAIQTLFATGVRISELPFITVEAAMSGRTEISLKGKTRTIFLPTKLCTLLKKYARDRKISSGPIFVTRNGKPFHRSNIWAAMKKLCAIAGVDPHKVFPHNLRKLFARTYYNKNPNLAELADIMGHSDVNTTRIYTATTGAECKKRLDRLNLVL